MESTLTGRLSTMTNALHAALRLIPQDLLSTGRLGWLALKQARKLMQERAKCPPTGTRQLNIDKTTVSVQFGGVALLLSALTEPVFMPLIMAGPP